jgi:excisionase family DNA binding protein
MSLMRIERLADRLGVSVPTVRLWVKKEVIPFYRGDRILMFDLEEVLTSLRANGGARVAGGAGLSLRQGHDSGSPTERLTEAMT